MLRSRPLVLGVLVAVAVVALQALLVALFAGPAVSLEPRDLPIAVAGPPAAVAALRAELEAAHPGAFAVLAVPDAAAADSGIKHRQVYGAFVLTPQGVTVHMTTAGSPAVAALLTRMAPGFGPAPPVDVVPADPGDPRGAGLGATFLPVSVSALLAGVLMVLFVPRRGARVTGLLTFSVLAGLAGAAVQQFWLGVLPGDYSSNAAAIGLFALAIAAPVTAFGRTGIVLGLVLFVLVGNALSGVATAPELLPQPWGTVGQYLPTGAGVTLLRSVAYFGGSGAAPEAAALLAYAIGGLVLAAVRRGIDHGTSGG